MQYGFNYQKRLAQLVGMPETQVHLKPEDYPMQLPIERVRLLSV